MKAFCVTKQGKKEITKKLNLTPAQLEKEITTAIKRAKFKAGRIVKVRREGKVFRYYSEDNKRAGASA